MSRSRQRVLTSLPAGTLPVGAGMVVAGLTAYGFLVVSARVLGPARYASLSALWFVGFLATSGFLLPLEQELTTAVATRRAVGNGVRPVVRQAVAVGFAFTAVLVVVLLAASGLLIDELFDGNGLLLVALGTLLFGYCGEHLLRGILAGESRFGPYGVVLAAEGGLRLAACVVAAVLSVRDPGVYGLMVGFAPLVASALVARSATSAIAEQADGPDARWQELLARLGYLVTAAVMAQILVNAAPVAAKLLAAPSDSARAGRFVAALVLARTPLFLFAAVQSTLLPKLAHQIGDDSFGEFRRHLGGLLALLLGVVVLATSAAAVAGPETVRLLFGARFELGRTDLAVLTAANTIHMLALTLSQALIAMNRHRAVVVGWLMGTTTLLIVTALGSDLLTRVEFGFLSGEVVATAAMATFVVMAISRRKRAAG